MTASRFDTIDGTATVPAVVPPFRPPWWSRNPVLQTGLAQLAFRLWGQEIQARGSGGTFRGSTGLRMRGVYSEPEAPLGLVAILPGWEGHANSTYVLRMTKVLTDRRFKVFRLNYPDHGDTVGINEEVFNLGMLPHVMEVLEAAAQRDPDLPLYLVGFSMGGNFTLHLACNGLPRLRLGVAISPPVDFAEAAQALERSFFHRFFLREWKRTLLRKQELFPNLYDFAELGRLDAVGKVAAFLLSRYHGFVSLDAYYAPYRITPERLRHLRVPVRWLAAKDDPLLGTPPYERFMSNPKIHLHLQERGGHVGFLSSLFGPAWFEPVVADLIEADAQVARAAGAT